MGDWAPLDIGASLVNGLIGMFSSQANNKRQIRAAKEMQLEQERFSKEMFNLENEYNTPSAQRDRMIDAQINPAVAWANGLSADTGNGQGNGSISPVMPSTEAVPSPIAGMVGTKPFEALNAYMNAKKTASETAKSQKEYEVLSKELVKADYDIAYAKVRNYLSSVAAKYADQKEYAELVYKVRSANNLILVANNLRLDGKIKEAEEKYKIAQKELTDKQITQLGIELDYLPQMLSSKIRATEASAAASAASATESYAAASEHNAGARLKNAEAWTKEFENKVIDEVGKEDSKVARTNMLWNYVNQYEIGQKTREQIEVYIDLLKIEKDQKKIRLYIDAIGTLLHGAAAIAPLAKP